MPIMQITDMDYNAARRNAGTMMTSSQNGGRIDSYERAESMGIEVKKTWIATLDGHTRSSHIYLDGQTRDIDEPFESEIGELMFPGDPEGESSDIYGCRCTMTSQIKGFERDPSDLGLRHDEALAGMTYEEWKNAKGDEPLFKSARNRKDDILQMGEYLNLLGNKAIPTNIKDFQDLKYKRPAEWETIKQKAREARRAR